MKTHFLATVLVCATFVGSLNLTYAQSRDITVTVQLEDVISGGGPEDGGTAQGSGIVDFYFDTAEKYAKTQSQTVSDQLRVLSTSPYVVHVKAQTASFLSQISAATLPLDILKISASKKSESDFEDEVTPSIMDQQIIATAVATLDQGYDFKYKITPNQVLIDAPKEAYSVVLTYSVTAQ